MTESEAIEYQKSFKENFSDFERINIACDMAIQALEKQIPKKPMQGEPFWWIDTVKVKGRNKQVRKKSYSHVCPCCGKGVAMLSNVFCNHCGQKLDWSDEEWED